MQEVASQPAKVLLKSAKNPKALFETFSSSINHFTTTVDYPTTKLHNIAPLMEHFKC